MSGMSPFLSFELTGSDKNQEYFEAVESKVQEVNLVVQKQLKDSRQSQAGIATCTRP